MGYVAVKAKRPDGMPTRPDETYLGYFWAAYGCSWHGNITKRDGKAVRCGHRHRTEEAAEKCRDKMRKERPGNCQDYRVAKIHVCSSPRSRA